MFMTPEVTMIGRGTLDTEGVTRSGNNKNGLYDGRRPVAWVMDGYTFSRGSSRSRRSDRARRTLNADPVTIDRVCRWIGAAHLRSDQLGLAESRSRQRTQRWRGVDSNHQYRCDEWRVRRRRLHLNEGLQRTLRWSKQDSNRRSPRRTTRDDRLWSLGGEVLGDERCVRRRIRDIRRRRGSFFLDLSEQPGLNRGGRALLLRMIAGETAGLEDMERSSATLPLLCNSDVAWRRGEAALWLCHGNRCGHERFGGHDRAASNPLTIWLRLRRILKT